MRLSLEVYTPNLKPQNLTPFTGRSLNDTSCPMMMTPSTGCRWESRSVPVRISPRTEGFHIVGLQRAQVYLGFDKMWRSEGFVDTVFYNLRVLSWAFVVNHCFVYSP